MAPSSVDQTTQSQPPLTTSEQIKGFHPKEVYENWFKCYGNPDAHRQKELSHQTHLLTLTEEDIAEEESILEHAKLAMQESDAQYQKMGEYWIKTHELAKENGFDGAEHVRGVYRLYQAAVNDHRHKSSSYFSSVRALRRTQKELDRYKQKIDEINEGRRQLKVFGKHYLGRGRLSASRGSKWKGREAAISPTQAEDSGQTSEVSMEAACRRRRHCSFLHCFHASFHAALLPHFHTSTLPHLSNQHQKKTEKDRLNILPFPSKYHTSINTPKITTPPLPSPSTFQST